MPLRRSGRNPMDLRRTLVARLALSFVGLVLAFGVVWFLNLREDALAEQLAAARLVDVLLADDGPDPAAHISAVLARGGLRHVDAALLPAGAAPPPIQFSPWLKTLGLSGNAVEEHRISLGAQVLLIRPDPNSEFQEKLWASGEILVMLLLFCAACLAMTWFAVHRALSPVKELEAGLSRLERGEESAGLPAFELREFSSIAGVIDRVAANLNRAREAQRRLTQQMMDIQDKERRDLAAELHDEFGQSLTAISATATYIERHVPGTDRAVLIECAREIGSEARRIAGHVRQMLTSLRPYGIEDSDMGENLGELVTGWQARLPDRRIESRIEALPVLPPNAGLALYRCLQEALTNCVRHSGATTISVECVSDGNWVRLQIADNGRGRAQHLQAQAGTGLLGLRERLTMAGGSLAIEDGSGGGVVLTARVPVTEEEEVQ